MKLEDFIQQHRDAFEEEGPGPRVWASLEKSLPVKQKAPVVRMMARHWWKAAILIALIVNAGILLRMMPGKKIEHIVVPEMEEVKGYYTSQIERKIDELKRMPDGYSQLDSTTQKELQLRNETYVLLEKELQQNPGNERIRSAMVRYYQMKLELLDRILEEREKITQEKQHDVL